MKCGKHRQQYLVLIKVAGKGINLIALNNDTFTKYQVRDIQFSNKE
jgi:hypothetical protein